MPQTQPATSPNLIISLLEANATGQSVRVNEAVNTIDALTQGSVKDKDLATPPGSPASGDRYIVAASPTGAWAGKANYITGWYNSAWLFWGPKKGWTFQVEDESKDYQYNGSAWVEKTSTVTTAPTWTVVTKTSNFTASTAEAAVYLIDASSGNVTMTLPAVAGVSSRGFFAKRTDSSANTVTIDANASETIDGDLTQSLNPLDSMTLVCSGSAWFLL